jgi:hypothetical protein
MSQNYGMTQKGEYAPDALIAGSHPVVEIPVTIAHASTNTLSRGQILGVISASGKYTKLDTTKSDGSQTPKALLGADVDAVEQDVKSFAYVHGEFSADALIGLSDAVKADLQAIGIYVK